MMRIRAIWIVCLLAFLSGCGGIEFNVEMESETVVERGTLVEQYFPVIFDQFMSIRLSDTEEFENQGVTRRHVDSLRMTSFDLEVVDPDDGDMSFLRSLEFFVEADGEPRKRVAYSPDGAFADAPQTVELEIEDIELQPYAAAESFSLTSDVTASRRPSVDTTIEASVIFRVRASL